jgi:ankyrin repeat protein
MARSGRPNKSDPRIETISYDILKGNNEKVIKLLSELGIDSQDSYLRNPLIWATFYNNIELLAWLIKNGANIDHQDRNGYCALHFAGQQKSIDSAKLLLENDADINLMDIHGNPPIWTAIFNSKGNYELVRLYVLKGADLDSENKHNISPRKLAETIAGFDLNSINKEY